MSKALRKKSDPRNPLDKIEGVVDTLAAVSRHSLQSWQAAVLKESVEILKVVEQDVDALQKANKEMAKTIKAGVYKNER